MGVCVLCYSLVVLWSVNVAFPGHIHLFLYKGTIKPILSCHSKKDKIKILMTNGSLMKVKVLQNALPLEHSAIRLSFIER